MKLAVLWDPENPAVPVAPVLEALSSNENVCFLTFAETSHRTAPNGQFEMVPLLQEFQPDAVLWVEGGPLPRDLHFCKLKKACWLVNGHLEPTLHDLCSRTFDLCLTTQRARSIEKRWRWLPLACSAKVNLAVPGVRILAMDPTPPAHLRWALGAHGFASAYPRVTLPIVLCPGLVGVPQPALYDSLAAGEVTIVDSETDLRDLAHPGDHVLACPSTTALQEFLMGLVEDPEPGRRISFRAREIAEHLHKPADRARQLWEYLQSPAEVLGGDGYSPTVSILTYSYKFLNRFRIYLESLARQELSAGTLEIVVADPMSPDGLADHLRSFALANRHLRVVRMPVAEKFRRNRGFCINRAFDASIGRIIISTDGDVVFPPKLIERLGEGCGRNPRKVHGVLRVFLDEEVTGRILEGALDPFKEFPALCRSPGDGQPHSWVGVLGYCQAVVREAFAMARYPEEFDRINQSDVVFLERLKRFAGVEPELLRDQAVLHLWHPREWEGTTGQR